ncbi:MAG: hypothetical protein ACRDWA_17040 [Acidimicrobiia bacterium]
MDQITEFGLVNYGLVDRATVLSAGGSDDAIQRRLDRREWQHVFPGVYMVGITPLNWHGRLRAATLAAGSGAVISHRTAAQLWGLEGVSFPRIELTVPYVCRPLPSGIVVHRTRRRIITASVQGIPTTPAERAILDTAWSMPTPTIELLYDSGIRQRIITPASMADCVGEFGTKGVRGRHKVLRVLDGRRVGAALASPAETQALRVMRQAGIEEPERQFIVILSDGTVAILDFAWPRRLKAVEIDGLVAHATARQLEEDLKRQNLLFELSWQLRRFSARTVQRQPGLVAAEIARFLAA